MNDQIETKLESAPFPILLNISTKKRLPLENGHLLSLNSKQMNDPQTNRKSFLKRAGLGFAGIVAIASGTRASQANASQHTSAKGITIRAAKHSVRRKDFL
ncbi:MAG: hypothetical protein AAGC73_00360 [Verrucomicrobiota bacterium]